MAKRTHAPFDPSFVTPTEAIKIADRCADAYSFDVYGERRWRGVAKALALDGFNSREIEAIMRSKWTRWAQDGVHPRKATGADVVAALHKMHDVQAEVTGLVAGTVFAEVEPPTGWENSSTGGGCTAWSKTYGSFVVNIVGAEDVVAPTSTSQPMSVEIYAADGNAVLSFNAESFDQVLDILTRINHVNCEGFPALEKI